MAHRLLVVEDAPDIAAPLLHTLRREGYDVSWQQNGTDALAHLREEPTDLVVLDLGLPDMDGLDVCREARELGYAGAIMICTARGQELDKVVGLDQGADDYLSKPFGLAELHARVRALLRRAAPVAEAPAGAAAPAVAPPAQPDPAAARAAAASGLVVDTQARRVRHGGTEVVLSAKEFDVLALLVASPGAVVSRERLMSEVWDEHWFGSTKTLDVTIGRLRQKLDDHGVRHRITNVRGVGFRLDEGLDA